MPQLKPNTQVDWDAYFSAPKKKQIPTLPASRQLGRVDTRLCAVFRHYCDRNDVHPRFLLEEIMREALKARGILPVELDK